MKKTNHLLHLVLAFFTAGLWLFIYIPLLVVRAAKPETSNLHPNFSQSNLEPTVQSSATQPNVESGWEPKAQEVQASKKKWYEPLELSATNLGYKEGSGMFSSVPYQLNCGHIIRAKNFSSTNSKIGKKVFCVVCSAPRDVMGPAQNLR